MNIFIVPRDGGSGRERFERVIRALEDRGCFRRPGCKPPTSMNPTKARASCPVHGDRNPSLVLTHNDIGVGMYCHGGCKPKAICAALGLQVSDLGGYDKRVQASTRIVATYDYIDIKGEVLAQKVRFAPKSFRWRSPSGAWTLKHGIPNSLYRIGDVIECHRVYLTEGEKATDLLHSLNVPAVCPPSGAAKWSDAWAELLITAGCHELMILADNDVPGRRHAEVVAASAYARQLRVKVLHLPNLPQGADVADYLAAGHTVADLEIMAENESWWHPGLEEARRLERHRAQTRARVQKFRARRRGNAAYVKEAV